jgi:hypothetical protein
MNDYAKLFLYLLVVCCAPLVGGAALTAGEAHSNKQVCDIVCTPYQGEWKAAREACACKDGVAKKNVCEWKVVEESE